MNNLPVDIDSEAIHFDGAWRTRDELAQAIRAMLDSGNYGISRHSAALEALSRSVADLQEIGVRFTAEMADALADAAANEGRTPGAIIRDAVATYLSAARAGRSADPEGRRATHPELPAVDVADDLPAPAAPAPVHAPPAPVQAAPAHAAPPAPPPGLQPAQVLAGPGALRNAEVRASVPSVVVDSALQSASEAVSPEEAANAVELTPRARADGPPPNEKPERGWFGG